MTLLELQTALKEPGQCRRCRESSVVPSHTWQGSLLLKCTHCNASEWTDLPRPTKKLVYLDNGVISNIASARERGESDDPYTALANVLQDATTEQVIAVGHSPIARSEYEARSEHGFLAAREQDFQLGSVHLRHPREIYAAQLCRAFACSMDAGEAHPEVAVDLKDAYRDDPHAWTDFAAVHLNWRTPTAWRESEAAAIDATHRGYLAIQQEYMRDALTVAEVERAELAGYGRAIRDAGHDAITRAANGSLGVDGLFGWPVDVYMELVKSAHSQSRDWNVARTAVDGFLLSEAASRCLYVRLNARLLAHLVVGTSRRIERGDPNDVEQIAAYAPYVDVMVVDKFSAHLAGPASANTSDIVTTKVISSRHDSIRALTEEIKEWRTESPYANVARRIHDVEAARGVAAYEFMRSQLEDDP